MNSINKYEKKINNMQYALSSIAYYIYVYVYKYYISIYMFIYLLVHVLKCEKRQMEGLMNIFIEE